MGSGEYRSFAEAAVYTKTVLTKETIKRP